MCTAVGAWLHSGVTMDPELLYIQNWLFTCLLLSLVATTTVAVSSVCQHMYRDAFLTTHTSLPPIVPIDPYTC